MHLLSDQELVLTKMLNKEPILNIGIILPQDKRNEVSFSFSNPENYTIKFKDSTQSQTPQKLTVTLNDGDTEIIKIKDKENFGGITIYDVPAGRDFHWGKKINVILPGNLRITRYNDCLLVINEVPLEKYLGCVAVSEMNSSCPDEFLIAQTITARSWILAGAEKKHLDLGIDACNDDCCQRYQGTGQQTKQSCETVKKSHGTVLTYGNEICDARYSKSCGGFTENCENVWDMKPKPYLKSIFDGKNEDKKVDWEKWITQSPYTFCSPQYIDEKSLSNYLGNVDENHRYFRWKVRFSQKEFCKFFSEKINEYVSKIKKISVINRGESGRIIRLNLEFQKKNESLKTLQLLNEYDIRKTLHPSFLYSSAFIPKLNETHIEFSGAGWGHGVGLCQIGALGMALNGYSSKNILNHYFQESTLEKLY